MRGDCSLFCEGFLDSGGQECPVQDEPFFAPAHQHALLESITTPTVEA